MASQILDITEAMLLGSEAKLDAEKGVVRDVKILGGQSANGRTYPDDVMARAVKLYEGAKVNVDHDATDSEGRKYAERFGAIRNVRLSADGLRGDLHFNPKHPVAEQFAWDVQNAPQNCGFSHHATIRVKRDPRGKGVIVEEIQKVKSVDLVANPATTGGVFESITKESDMSLETVSLESLRKERPDLVDALIKESAEQGEAKALQTKLTALEAENKKLVTAAKARELNDAIESELRAAGIDPASEQHVSKLFRRQLDAAESAEAREEMITDRLELLNAKGLIEGTESADDKQVAKESQQPRSKIAGTINAAAPKFKDSKEFAKFLKRG